MQPLTRKLLTTSLLSGTLALNGIPAYALPTGGQVSGGQAVIASGSDRVTISQSSPKAIIDWNSFNIGANESVSFSQPSASSIALNRIHDSNPSQILGSLTANGRVWLVNPNGVFFGPDAKVNVAGLLASTADIDNDRFMAGDFSFTHPGNPAASIVNQGSITVEQAGLATLVAPNVANSGVITAKLGKVHLASGDSFTLDMYGDGLLSLAVSDQVASQLVANSGLIVANGGSVQLTAAAGVQVVDSLINNSGVIQAQSVGNQNGQIALYAEGSNAVAGNVASNKGQLQGSSTVLNSGTLDASGMGAGQTGGSISVLGDHVGILSGSVIDASGDVGGGTVKIGGDFHGQGTTPTASATVVQQDTSIKANAITSGNGGNVTVWSDDYTDFAGSMEARGGLTVGNGGFVETSGKQTLTMQGIVDASAPNGNAGTWLMDPNNLVINGSATSNAGSSPNWTAASGGGNVLNTDIDTALNAGTNVDLTASGSIEVAANISKTAGPDATLTLAAGTDITVDGNITSSAGKLNMVFDADTGNSGSGSILIYPVTITSNNGYIIMGGGSSPSTMPSYADGNSYGNGIFIYYSTISSGSGNITINGANTVNVGTNWGVYDQGGSITSGDGNIMITGSSSVGAGGVLENFGGLIHTTGAGNITINGTAGSGSGAFNVGMLLQNNIQASGTGNIILNGTGGTNGSSNYDIDLQASAIATGGHITLNGTGGMSNGNVSGISSPGTITANGAVSITAVNGLALGSVSGSSIVAQTTGANADLTINNGATLAASGSGTVITLASGRNFINNAGSSALSATSGRWLVYSTNPANDTDGGLSNNFRRFSCSYGGSCPTLGSDNGFLYSYTPFLTLTPTGSASISYGAAVPVLSSLLGDSISGYLGSDGTADMVTGSAYYSTNYTQGGNVGSYNVTTAAGTLASSLGYGFSGSTLNNALTVNRVPLTIAANPQSITYGTIVPSTTASYSGFVNGDTSTSLTTAPTLSSANRGVVNAGTYSGNYTASGAVDANYTINYAAGNLTIDKATLTVSADSGKTMVYGALPSTVQATIDLRTPISQLQLGARSTPVSPPGTVSAPIYVESDLFNTFGLNANDPYPWWTGVIPSPEVSAGSNN